MGREQDNDHQWVIVLAAGEGTRLASITTMLHGHPVPKQFATLLGDRSLLQNTLERSANLAPAVRTVVVVAADRVPLAEAQMGRYPGVQIVSQPLDRGTVPGLLLPLAHVLARDPQARVLVLPSDHVVSDQPRFHEACRRALRAADEAPCGVALIGATATMPATDLGWISLGDPERPGPAGSPVRRFLEKPDQEIAQALFESGALWNTLILAATGNALWALAARKLPAIGAELACYRVAIGRPEAPRLLEDLYARIPSADLSRDVLEKATGLAAVALTGAGWTDCGTPQRVLDLLGSDEVRRRFSSHSDQGGGGLQGQVFCK